MFGYPFEHIYFQRRGKKQDCGGIELQKRGRMGRGKTKEVIQVPVREGGIFLGKGHQDVIKGGKHRKKW